DQGLAGDRAYVDGVRFGADSTFSAAGTQLVQVSVYRLDGVLVRENLVLLARVDQTVADTALGMLDAVFAKPVEVALDATLVVELAIGDGEPTASSFYPAGNQAGD